MSEPIHIEVTSYEGASKWVKDIVSHTREDIREAFDEDKTLYVKDSDGCETLVDMSSTYMIRIQDDEVYQRRSRDAKDRRSS